MSKGMIVCDPDKIKSDGVHGAPDLVVEVLSPSTMRNDKIYKKEVYVSVWLPISPMVSWSSSSPHMGSS